MGRHIEEKMQFLNRYQVKKMYKAETPLCYFSNVENTCSGLLQPDSDTVVSWSCA